VRAIFERLGDSPDFSWLDVLALVEREPELALGNSAIQHKTYLDVDHRASK
jgi:hypothetical protein